MSTFLETSFHFIPITAVVVYLIPCSGKANARYRRVPGTRNGNILLFKNAYVFVCSPNVPWEFQ